MSQQSALEHGNPDALLVKVFDIKIAPCEDLCRLLESMSNNNDRQNYVIVEDPFAERAVC